MNVTSMKMRWIKSCVLLGVALLSAAEAYAVEYTSGGIVFEIEDGHATPLRYDGTTTDVVLNSKLTYEGREYDIWWWVMTDEAILTNHDNIRTVDASGCQDGFLYPFSGCRNLETVKFPEAQYYYSKRQFFDCPSLDLPSVLTPNIQFVESECFALSEPTDLGKFDNLDIHLCSKEDLQNRIYTTVIIVETPEEYLTRSMTLEKLTIPEIKTLEATGFKVDDYYDEPFTSLQTLVVTDGAVSISDNPDKFPSIQSVAVKGNTEFLSIGSLYYPSLDNIEINVSGASEIQTCMIGNINSLQSLNLENKVRDLYVTGMPSLSSLEGLGGVTRAHISECKILTKIELPDIEEFSSDAFNDNKALTVIYLGDKLREIGTDGVFSGCSSLRDLIYGGTIEQWLGIKKYFDETSYSSAMLAKVTNFWYGHGNAMLTQLTELNSSHVTNVDSINIASFIGFKGLTKIDLPATVKTICASAFEGCINLTDINIRAERIDQHAFIFCNNIENYTLGDQLKYIGPAFRSNKTNYGTVNFLGTPEQWMKITRTTTGYIDPWDPESGEGYSRLGTPNISVKDLLFNGQAIQDLVIENVDRTGQCFAGIQSLKTVTIKCGDKLPEISSGSFYNCKGLEKVSVEFLKSRSADFDHSNGFVIGEEAFAACTALKDIEVLDYIKTIGPKALRNSLWLREQPSDQVVYLTTEKGLTAYTYNGTPVSGSKLLIKDGCQAINSGAFGRNSDGMGPDFSGVEAIEIPESVMFIGQYALDGISFEGDFTLPATVEEIESNDFYGEIDTFTFAESKKTLKGAASDDQSTIYIPKVKTVNYSRNFDSKISVQGLEECTKVNYGANITEVTPDMKVPYSAKEVSSFNVTPPTCGYTTSVWNPELKIYSQFSNVNFDECVLYVPYESIDAYRNAEGWNLFTNIQAVSSGIQNISADSPDSSLETHYDLNGRIIRSDVKGIHIVVGPNGKATKRVIK